VTSGIGVGSGESCRKINVNQTAEDLIHHGQTAVMATLLQCWPLEVAQHCSDAAVDVIVTSHVASCVSLNIWTQADAHTVPRGVARNSFWVGIIFYCTILQSYILAA